MYLQLLIKSKFPGFRLNDISNLVSNIKVDNSFRAL